MRPCSVVFSLPHQHTESSSIGWNNPSCGGGGDGWGGADEGNCPKDWQQQWGHGEGDIAVLRVEVRTQRSVGVDHLCGHDERSRLGRELPSTNQGYHTVWLSEEPF